MFSSKITSAVAAINNVSENMRQNIKNEAYHFLNHKQENSEE